MGGAQSHKRESGWIRFSLGHMANNTPYDKKELEILLRQFRSAARHAAEEDQWLLHKDGFELALQKAGLKGFTHEQAEKLFAAFDKDQSGSVDFREFVSGLVVLLNGEDDEMVKLSFELYDMDKSGYLEAPEIYRVLRSMNVAVHHLIGKSYDPEHQEETFKLFMKLADKDGDGRISLKEYYRVMTNERPHEVVYDKRESERNLLHLEEESKQATKP